MQHPSMDKIPPEIISQILLTVIGTYPHDIRAKWRSPLLFRCISRRFYQITSNTQALWRYLYIRQPIHPYISNYISQSGSLPLIADVLYNVNEDDESQSWQEVISILVPTFPRLTSLVFQSPSNHDPIVALLQYKMPILDSLSLKGKPVPLDFGGEVEPNIPLSHLTSLRYLALDDFPRCINKANLPDTLEELYLDIGMRGSTHNSRRFWNFLPPNLRVLRTADTHWEGLTRHYRKKVHAPSLTDLHLSESITYFEFSILQFLDAPCLQTLDATATYDRDIRETDWYLDFPALTHLTWRSLPEIPRLDNFLRRCGNLTTVHFKGGDRSTLIPDFVTALVYDLALLPCLADLMVPGASILTLREVVLARPQLQRLEVFMADLHLHTSSTEEFAEWWECREWLESHVSFHVNNKNEQWFNDLVHSREPIVH